MSASWIPGVPRAPEAWAGTISPVKESAETYKVYNSKVPTQVHPGVSVNSKVMSIMNSFISDIFEKLAGPAPATCRVCPGERAA